MTIVLIGFMGSGKSTIAKHLSHLLKIPYLEMDDLVYQKTNTSHMNAVFEKGGEPLLRETEIAIAQEYASKQRLIISTGGGVILNPIILDSFKEKGGTVIFLNASFKEIVKRLDGDDSRPLFNSITKAKKLYDFRLPLYFDSADEIIDVDFRSPHEISVKIQELISKKGYSDGF